MKTSQNVYTVKQVNLYIKRLFNDDFILNNIYIKGEVSNCKYHSTGHIYFSLKDESGVLAAVMWRSDAAKLRFRLEDGMQVV
ncbi:MAG: exodeoxyribonuclease VII large subunit, partial [Lachnospiraceae bacterium]|nr:exodeoxyribonuclease VII large subunit [Lachnospiraceae bacterium]